MFKKFQKFDSIPTELVIENNKLYLQKEDGSIIGKGVPLIDEDKKCKEVELRKSDTHIQWRYVGEDEWVDLVSLAELKSGGEEEVYLVNASNVEAKKQIAFYTRKIEDIPKLKESMAAYKDFNLDGCLLCITVFNNFNTNEPAINELKDENIRELISYAQEVMGWDVTIRMHNHGNYKGEEGLKEPENTELWFENYNNLVQRIGLIAQEYGQEHFIICNEMMSLGSKEENTQYWENIINELKEKELKVGCSFSIEELVNKGILKLWDKLDFYGLNLYPSLSTKTKEWAKDNYKNLCKAFYTRDCDLLEVLDSITKTNKSIWITEFGCMNSNLGLSLPSYWGDNTEEDEEVQRIYLEVAFEMLKYISIIDVLTLWCGNLEDGSCVIGRESENVLKYYWGK
ncbi:MAG: glycoside hydrolase family 113 [Peptostreptococcaceae bacterium]